MGPMNRKRRPKREPRGAGFTRVPRHVWSDPELSPELVGLLCYFASHASSWIFRRSVFLPEIGLSEDKFDKLRRKLERLQYLKKTTVYRHGKVVGVRFKVDWQPLVESLNPQIPGSEKKAEPAKPGPGFSGEISRVIKSKECPSLCEDCDVVPDGEVTDFAQKVRVEPEPPSPAIFPTSPSHAVAGLLGDHARATPLEVRRIIPHAFDRLRWSGAN